MKKLAIALTTLAVFSAPALAADMGVKAPMRAAAPVAYASSWTGFWISGGFGYGLMDIDHSVTDVVAPFPVFDRGHDNGGRGWLGKVGAGFDFQGWPWSNIVIGAFTDGQWSDIKGNYDFRCPGGCAGPSGLTGLGLLVAVSATSPFRDCSLISTVVGERPISLRSTMLTTRPAWLRASCGPPSA